MNPSTLCYLNAGVLQSATHIEQMCIDMARLFETAFPDIQIDHEVVNGTPFIGRLRLLGAMLAGQSDSGRETTGDRTYISDTIRGWLAMSIAETTDWTDDERLAAMAPFFNDPHFAVREWAWLALRPQVVLEPLAWTQRLSPLLIDESDFTRRFAVELLRPRSVWGQHIDVFKRNPELAAGVLEAVKCDASAYVRDAVSNWFNDAARTNPEWVAHRMAEWSSSCVCSNTQKIVKRALRSVKGFEP